MLKGRDRHDHTALSLPDTLIHPLKPRRAVDYDYSPPDAGMASCWARFLIPDSLMRTDLASRLTHPAALLVYAGNLFFVVSLFYVRAARIRGSDTPYWSPVFIGLLVGVAFLAALTTWAVYSGSLQTRLNMLTPSRRVRLAIAWAVASYMLLIAIPAILTLVQPYLLPFIVWLTFLNVALLIMSVPPNLAGRLSSITWHGGGARLKWALRKLVAAAVIVLIPLVVLEIGLRVYFTYFGSEHDRAAYTYTGEQIAETQSIYVGMPYVNYGLTPNSRDHNSLGFRGPEIVQPKPDGVFRIVAIGGSTTYGISIPWDQAYPAQLERILRQEYGYTNVEVINGGVIAYNSYDLLAHFEYRVLDLNPDVVIFYEGINDVIARLVDPNYYNGLNPMRGVWRTGFQQLSPSVLYRVVAIKLGWMRDPTDLTRQFYIRNDIQRCGAEERDYCTNLGMTPEQVLEANPPIYYERNLNNLIAVAQANDVQIMLSSWAYFPDSMGEGVNPFMTYPHIQQGVAEHNAIVAKLAEKWSLPYYDLMAKMPYDKTFWLDGLHMTARGAHEQAAEYAAFLHENGLIPTPRG